MSDISLTALFYFYSTIAQATAALVSLYGIFVVFRLQISTEKITLTNKALVNFLKKYLKDSPNVDKDWDLWLEKDISIHLRWAIAYSKEVHPNLVPALSDYYLQIYGFESFKKSLYSKLWVNMLGLISPLFFSLLALSILPSGADFLDSLRLPCLFYLTIVFIHLVWSVLTAVSGPSEVKMNNPETNLPKEFKGAYSKEAIKDIVEKVLRDRGIKHEKIIAEV